MHPLIPLLIVVIILLVGAVVGFVIWSVATDIANKTSKKMEDHNVSFGKDGMKIGMKEIKNEDYVGRTQNVLVNVWNLSTWPAYKSRFWNKEAGGDGAGSSSGAKKGGSAAKRPGAGSHRSSSASTSTTHRSTSERTLHHSTSHTSHRTEHGRLAEPRPGVRRTPSGTTIPGSFD